MCWIRAAARLNTCSAYITALCIGCNNSTCMSRPLRLDAFPLKVGANGRLLRKVPCHDTKAAEVAESDAVGALMGPTSCG